METWTIQKLLNWITDYFEKNEIDAPRLSAEMLMAHVLKLSRIELYTNFNAPVKKPQLDTLHTLVKRAGASEPLAYMIGRTEFYSLEIKVTSDCLIPRPETELLVERAIEFLRQRQGRQYACDLCTGSGCIAVAVAKGTKDTQIIATDICDAALAVAAENVAKHQLDHSIQLLCGDLFAPVIEGLDETRFDLIASNPPYVSTSEYETLEKNVKDYEPEKALHAGSHGLDTIKRIIEQAPQHLKPDAALMLEIGYTQADAVVKLLEQTGEFTDINVEKDHAKNDRLITAVKKDS
ncbi:MAG TPA: peptide chain release factor N(5)-glutamine methyltransferase [Phycisphaerales bacterium]|nr:peptide chain release factor N(5)-glutamine methyltransferase [Phycisphaerales bacterium]